MFQTGKKSESFTMRILVICHLVKHEILKVSSKYSTNMKHLVTVEPIIIPLWAPHFRYVTYIEENASKIASGHE